MADLLSDIMMQLSMKGTLYFRTSFKPPWGVRVPAYSNVARFHYAHRGECLIRHERGGDPIRLAQGDLVIIPGGAGHALYCQPETEPDATTGDDGNVGAVPVYGVPIDEPGEPIQDAGAEEDADLTVAPVYGIPVDIDGGDLPMPVPVYGVTIDDER